MTIHEKIHAYYSGMTGPHHRYHSWEHCYPFFHTSTPEAIAVDRDHAALQLGFYLASWGMYRGSSFLLQHAYTVHLGVIDQLVAPRFSVLWEQEFGSGDNDLKLVPIIFEAIRSRPRGIQALYAVGRVPPGIRHARDKDHSWDVWVSARLRSVFHRRIQERPL